MATADERRKRKRASLVLALLLLATALILTIITLDPGTRRPDRAAPANPSQTAVPSPSPTASSPARLGGGLSGGGGSAGGSGAGCVDRDSSEMACLKNFTIAGNTAGLFPGGRVQLPLTVENPNQQDIRVTLLTVSVAGTSASACSGSNLQTTSYTGPGFVVPGDGSRTISLPVTMSRSAPDACQNVTFSLDYSGEAEMA